MQFILDHIVSIIGSYQGHPPLSAFLKLYFKKFPKLGSRDRKAITEAVFVYFRFGRFFSENWPVLQVLDYGLNKSNSKNALLKKLFPVDPAVPVIAEKQLSQPIPTVFSEGLSPEKWLKSLSQQPQLFIRVRKNLKQVVAILEEKGIEFFVLPAIHFPLSEEEGPGDCLSIQNGSAIDKVLNEEDYVVQDWASQQSMHRTRNAITSAPEKVWDVCAGAGGKSIFLKDKLPRFALFATDVRESILHNLKMRFHKYGFKGFQTAVVNSALAKDVSACLKERQFDLVICDVPCSGSGTWARNPEQFHFFKDKDLSKFEQLQYPIAFNAQQYLRSGGLFAYVTCSVFKKENEDVVAQLLENTSLSLIRKELIDGIDHKADCMFVALFRKN